MIILVVGLLLLGYVLITYAKAGPWIETMSGLAPTAPLRPLAGGPKEAAGNATNKHIVGGVSADVNPKELLPKGGLGAAWSGTNPIGLGQLEGQNFLDAKHNFGIMTVGQGNRNPTYDLRAEIPIPKKVVSPWNNSTIEPDTLRRGLGDFGCTSPSGTFNVQPTSSLTKH